jgi:hypothetical protein
MIAEIDEPRSATESNSVKKSMTYEKERHENERTRCGRALKGFILGGMITRSPLLLLTPLLFLAGCVNQSASYDIDSTDHALTVIVTQDYFWSKQASLRLVASRLPDCQRQFDLGKTPLADLNVELFSTGEESFLLRAGEAMWQVDTQSCSELPPPSANVQAQPIGVFHMDAKKKLVFERAEGAVASAQ